MDLGIEGKVALVTASSKGLGRAAAMALAGEGARVVISARGEDALRQAEASLHERGAEALAIQADVADPHVPTRLVAAAVDHFGSIDILVPNAGGPPLGRALEVTDEQIAAAVNSNLVASARLVREAAPHMQAGRWGRICCITSYSIKQPLPNLALSNLARTGLWAWAKTAAADLFPSGVTLNLACPGPHATDRMVQLGGADQPMGDPGDFGRIVAFLCSEPAAYISARPSWSTGQAVPVCCKSPVDVDGPIQTKGCRVQPAGRGQDEGQGVPRNDPAATPADQKLVDAVQSDRRRSPLKIAQGVREVRHRRRCPRPAH
jgi:3-oxoacyl-[acyl-carrier protein] reductase